VDHPHYIRRGRKCQRKNAIRHLRCSRSNALIARPLPQAR